jgi:hypothetical protein
MTDSKEDKLGEKASFYCYDCAEERTFEWATWSGLGFYGYPPVPEYGWECTVCGYRSQGDGSDAPN